MFSMRALGAGLKKKEGMGALGLSAHGQSLHQLPLATQLSDGQKTEAFIPGLSRENNGAARILVDSTGDQKNQYCALYFLHPFVRSFLRLSTAVVCSFARLH